MSARAKTCREREKEKEREREREKEREREREKERKREREVLLTIKKCLVGKHNALRNSDTGKRSRRPRVLLPSINSISESTFTNY